MKAQIILLKTLFDNSSQTISVVASFFIACFIEISKLGFNLKQLKTI